MPESFFTDLILKFAYAVAQYNLTSLHTINVHVTLKHSSN